MGIYGHRFDTLWSFKDEEVDNGNVEKEVEDFFKNVVKEDKIKSSEFEIISGRVVYDILDDNGFFKNSHLFDLDDLVGKILLNINKEEDLYVETLENLQKHIQSEDYDNMNRKNIDRKAVMLLNKDLQNIRRLYADIRMVFTKVSNANGKNIDNIYRLYDKLVGKPEKLSKNKKEDFVDDYYDDDFDDFDDDND